MFGLLLIPLGLAVAVVIYFLYMRNTVRIVLHVQDKVGVKVIPQGPYIGLYQLRTDRGLITVSGHQFDKVSAGRTYLVTATVHKDYISIHGIVKEVDDEEAEELRELERRQAKV